MENHASQKPCSFSLENAPQTNYGLLTLKAGYYTETANH